MVDQPTRRELEVLAAVLRHGCAKGAAEELGISPNTVRVHADHLYRKLGVDGREQAAIALGWLTIPSRVCG